MLILKYSFLKVVTKFKGNSNFSYVITNNKNAGEKGCICEQQENSIVIKLEDHQQSDETLPKST